jgi:hypothetical protein
MSEEGLPSEARGQDVGIDLRVSFPGSDGLEVEHATTQVRRQHLVFQALDSGEPVVVDLVQATEIARERTRLLVDAVSAEVFEQIVVGMDAVESGVRRMSFVEIPQKIIDEVRKRFGNGHGSLT